MIIITTMITILIIILNIMFVHQLPFITIITTTVILPIIVILIAITINNLNQFDFISHHNFFFIITIKLIMLINFNVIIMV